MEKIRKIIITFLATVLLIPNFTSPIVAQETTQDEKNFLRVATHNLAAPDENKAREISQRYMDHNIDIVGVQEADMYNGRNNYNTIEALENDVLLYSHFAKGRDYSDGDFGIGFLSKYDILEKSSEPIEHPSGSPATKVIERVVIEHNAKRVALYNVHLSWESLSLRQRQLKQLKDRVNNDPEEYIILVGDFNTDQHLREYSIFEDQFNMANGGNFGWYDTFLEPNDDPNMKHIRIDNILVSKNMSIENVYMDGDRYLSDHALFYADIKFSDANIPEATKNILPGKLLNYSHAENNTINTYDIYKITDGNSNPWVSESISETRKITIDLHGLYKILEFKIDWGLAPKNYTVNTYISNDKTEIYTKKDEESKTVTIPVNSVISSIEIVVNSNGKFIINEVLAYGNEEFGVKGKNIIPNHDFTSIVDEPQSQPPGFEGAHWDTGMWINQKKAEHWIYQKYPVSEDTSNYMADVLESDRNDSESQMVKIDKQNKTGSGFFKQMKLPINPNTSYTIGFWYKHDEIGTNALNLSITEFNTNKKELVNLRLDDLSKNSKSDWTYYTHTWTTNSNTGLFDIVFRLDNDSGTYFLEDVTLVENVSFPQTFEIGRHSNGGSKLASGSTLDINTNYFPLTPEEAGINVYWESEDETIATVDSNGIVQAITPGEVYITQKNNVTDRYHSAIKIFVIEKEKNNLIPNGDFSVAGDIPEDPGYFNQAAFHDTGLWRDTNEKPESWMFQKWRPDANSDDFKAYYLEEAGNRYVKVDVSTKANNTMNFLKNMNIPVEPNKRYILIANIQQLINDNDFLIRVERGGTQNNFKFQGIDEQLENYIVVFESQNANSINLIMGYEQNNRGSYIVDSVFLDEYDGRPVDITMNQEDLIMTMGETRELSAKVLPKEAEDKTIIWSVEDENVIKIDNDGNIIAVSAGETNIIASANANSSLKVSRKVTVYESDIPITDIKINNKENELNVGERRFMNVEFSPNYATESLNLLWSSSDETVAKFIDNQLITLKEGNTTITVEHNGLSDTYDLEVKDKKIDDYRIMRDRWRENLIGNEELMDLSDFDINHFVTDLSNLSNQLFSSMYKKVDRDEMSDPEIWDVVDTTDSAHMTTQFRNLYTLAQAFMIEGTDLYQSEELFNEVLYGLDYLMEYKGYNGSYSGNWWDWQIGSAQPFAHTLLILDDYLTLEQKELYTEPIIKYNSDVRIQIPNVTSTGANRTDIAISVLATAIILEDSTRMDQIPAYVPSVMFNENTTGDGYYIDGSFVQHGDKAYSGSYGVETIRGLSTIISIIADTKWGFDENTENYTNLFSIIPDTYLPIVHKGMNMAMNQGRSITRAPGTNKFAPAFSGASEISANLLTLADYMPDDVEQLIKEHVKSWYLDSKEYYDFMENARDLEMLLNLKTIIEDEDIEPKITHSLKMMTAMARAMNLREKFSAGVSMTSYKISNYEYGNTENPYGFHTGDGMLYLYNDDLSMYGESYWPTVDWYRLPGITVDTRPLQKGALRNATSADMRWVGGVSNGSNGSTGMTFDKSKQNRGGTTFDLKAKKSYFFVNDKIVALGSDIFGTTDYTIETIVENRMLLDDSSNLVLLNGDEIDEKTITSISQNDWVHLEGKTRDSNIGYYFLEEVDTLELNKVKRSGTYDDINNYFGSDKIYETNYFLMSVHHGQKVVDDKYAYVILPGITSEETEMISSENATHIIENSKNIHAIFDEEVEIFAANVFSKEKTTFDLSDYDFPVSSITVDNAPSIVLERIGLNELSIDISSPIRLGDTSTIEITLKNGQVINADSNIKNIETNVETISFDFDSVGLLGRSNSIILQYELEEDMGQLIDEFLELMDEASNMTETNYTSSSWETFVNVYQEADLLKESINNNYAIKEDELIAMFSILSEALDNLVLSGNLESAKKHLKYVYNLEDEFTIFGFNQVKPILLELENAILRRESQESLNLIINKTENLLKEIDKAIDLEEYEKILELLKTVDKDNYTEPSYNSFMHAYNKLKDTAALYNPEEKLIIDIKTLDMLYDKLEEAFENLEIIDDSVDDSDKDTDENPDDNQEELNKKILELKIKAQNLINEVLKSENISKNLKKEIMKLQNLVNDKEVEYKDLLDQYKLTETLINKGELPPTGISYNYYSYYIVMALSLYLLINFNRKRYKKLN